MSEQQPKVGGSGKAMTSEKASAIQSHAATHPDNKTARSGFDRRAQSAAAKRGPLSRK